METNRTILRVTDYGADPAGKGDSAKALQAALEAAHNTPGPVTLFFPRGEYHFYKEHAQRRVYHTSNTDSCSHPEKAIAILIEDQEDLMLDGGGSLFLMHGNMMALAVVRSKQITLRAFAWDFAVPNGQRDDSGRLWAEGCFTIYRFLYPSGVSVPAFRPPKAFVDGWSRHGWRAVLDRENHHAGWSVVGYDPSAGVSAATALQGPFSHVWKLEQLAPNRVRVFYLANGRVCKSWAWSMNCAPPKQGRQPVRFTGRAKIT